MTGPESSSIQEIVADLQAEVRRYQSAVEAKSRDLSGAELRAFCGDDLDSLARVRLHQHVNSHLPIGWPDMPPGFLPKLRAYAQKITRRLLRWYIDPLVAQQNQFNTAVTEVLASLLLQVERQEQSLRELQQKAGCGEHDLTESREA